MIAARATSQAAEQPERDLVGKLLLTGIEYTDAHPWIGFVGMAAAYALFVLLENLP